MKEFPSCINVINKNTFDKINRERLYSLLRNHIYIHILNRKNEEDCFVLDEFAVKYMNSDHDKLLSLIENIMKELNNLKWKTKLSYGNTALFIYSTPDPPKNCW